MIRLCSMAVAAIVVLSGCSDAPADLVQPPMLITPGYIKMNSGRTVQVLGYESCADAGDYKVIGNLGERKGAGCIRVQAAAQDFEITVGTAQGMVVERWRVATNQESISLVRPNGDAATVFRVVN